MVNVILFCVLTPVLLANDIPFDPRVDLPDPSAFVRNVWLINTSLLIFNMLPVYPLDGGQIFRALLWFLIGRARSMYVAAIVGFVGVGGLALLALWRRDIWLGLITVYVFQNCRQGWAHAKALSALER
ncbi:MAG: site-2 protease family protein [Chthoniobacter sp.]